MTLFRPAEPPDWAWNHYRRRSEALRALFPPMLPGATPNSPSQPSLELRALWNTLTGCRSPLTANDNLLPIYWIGDPGLYDRVYSEAIVSLDELGIEHPDPYAHDAAYAAWRLEIAQSIADLCPDDDFATERLQREKAVWQIFLSGYGCLGIFDETAWTYIVVKGDRDEADEKTKRSRRRPKAKTISGSQIVPTGSRDAVPSIQYPVPSTSRELVQVDGCTNRHGSGSEHQPQ